MPARRIGRQLRLVPALLVPTTRAVGWGPALAAFTVSLGLLALAVRPGLVLAAGQLLLWLRIATIVGALGWAFLLDDPSEPTTEGVAGSLLLRRTLRVVLLLPATAAWWVAVVWRVRAVYPGMSLPVAALTLEAAALLAVTLALGAAGSRLAPERRGGVVAAPALLALASVAGLLPAQVALYAQPVVGAWDDAHRRWALLLGLGLAAFGAASRDPAHRRHLSHLVGLARGLHVVGTRRPAVPHAEETHDQAGKIMIGDHDVSNADMSDALDGSMTRGRGDASRLSRRAVSRRAVVLATVAGASVAACNTLPTTPGTPDRPGPACREPLGPELPTTGNIRVSRDGCRSHAEPNLAVNPRDPRNLLGACIANGGSAITAYASFDGGVTWRSHGALEDSANGRDPSVSFDAAGRGYICANTDDLHVWRTDDGGRGFAAPTLATRGHKLDHPWLAADPTPGPPSATHLYAAWTGPDNTQLEFARSTDAGRGFEAPRALDTVRGPDQASIASPMLAAGPGGTIHIVYGVWPPLPQQGQGLRPEFPAPIRAISSTDRGQTWTEPAQLGIGVMEIRVTSDTNVPGLPAVVTHRKEAFAAAAFVVRQPGAPFTDIAVCVSRDRGRRWTAPRLVPRRGDDIIYTQPQLAIDESGRLALSAFAHRRGLVDVVVILADPGTSRFGPPTVVTSRPFDPARGGGQGKHGAWWIGDYQGLASAAGTVYPFWNDARYPGRLEIFAERMPTSNGIPSPSRSPSG